MRTKEKIITFIESQNRPVSRREIIKEVGITTSTPSIYKNITKLLQEGILVEFEGKRLAMSNDPHIKKVFDPIEWNIPTVLRRYQHDSRQLPLINLAQHMPEDLKKIIEEKILPEHGSAIALLLMNAMILLQFTTDNEAIFTEMYPELPFDDNIKQAAEEQLNDLLRRIS